MKPTARHQLWETALDQYGYITMNDARRLGLPDQSIWDLASRGKLEHVARGVYHFPELPEGARSPYMLAVLWTGVPEACLSHETALANYEVCDINPENVDVTVPSRYRIRRRGGELYTVHYENLTPAEIGWWEQIPMVTLPTAMRQCVEAGVPTYLLRQALENAQKTGALNNELAEKFDAALRSRDSQR
jgi:predicted transcriptional regulator of viral defense system